MRRMVFTFLCAIWASIGFGQHRLTLDYDIARFQGANSEVNVEIYYCLYPDEWNHIESGTGTIGAVKIQMAIYRNKELLYNKAWKMQDVIDPQAEQGARKAIVDMLRFSLPPANYRAILVAQDLNANVTSDTVSIELPLDNFSSTTMYMSDVELCQTISRTTAADVFTKNGMRVVPNPQQIYGESAPILYYYLEIYNMLENITDGKYVIHTFVSDNTGRPIKSVHAVKRTKSVIPSSVEVGTLNISSLTSGSYYLHSEIQSVAGETLLKGEKKFYVYNPAVDEKVQLSSAVTTDAVVSGLSDEEVEQELAYIEYIMTQPEKQELATTTAPSARRKFLARFWKVRDPNKKTVKNEMRELYLERVALANKQFSRFKDGWKTDMGRVLMIYGPPSDIQRYPNTGEGRPYQVWTYEKLEGGVQFIFIDMQGFNNYELVHSTYRKEVKNANWQELLKF